MSPDAADGDTRLWGGRFEDGPAPALDRINRSLPVDWRLWPFELAVDRAWIRELCEAGVVTADTRDHILAGLDAVQARLESGDPAREPDEDVHTLVERWLADEVGEDASQVRIGRSRNDVVATDTRLWTLEACRRVNSAVRDLQEAMIESAGRGVDVAFPAYTHLQRAQPTTAAHWLLSHFWPLVRARDRLEDARARVARLPLGAAAGTGSTVPMDRDRLSGALGFDGPCENSLDAVGSRDWVAEVLFAWTQLAGDLSRLAEDLVIYASAEFGLVRLSDAFSTGSSLMPQKRNPDGAELARARGGTLLGLLAGYLASLKGLPTGYSKDLQEDKRTLFAAEEAVIETLAVLAGTIGTLEFDQSRARDAISPEMLAADVAERLAAEGVPFRTAHEAIGLLVRQAETEDRSLSEYSGEESAAVHPALGALRPEWWDVGSALQRRSVQGGSAPTAVRVQLDRARDGLKG
ncbi:MAG: argininosuccinate lyase [marine benthic group bacterium]|nr:argininosuccinate lyase [Candidatus Benthicola marisminoris]